MVCETLLQIRSHAADGVKRARCALIDADLQALHHPAAEHARQGQTAMSGGITVHFSPTINAPGGDAGQIQTAMQMGYREFEQMFRRMMEDWDRRSYVRNAG